MIESYKSQEGQPPSGITHLTREDLLEAEWIMNGVGLSKG